MIVEVHSQISSSGVLISARRRAYEAAACKVGWKQPSDIPDWLDNPFVRHAIALQLIGNNNQSHLALRSSQHWQFDYRSISDQEPKMRVMSSCEADPAHANILANLGAEFEASLLTHLDKSRLDSAIDQVASGIKLAYEISPRMARDLLPHVEVIGILRRDTDPPPVLSASLRSHPGLVLLAEPRDALEAAEGLLHESTHCRLFDMEIVHEMLLVEDVAGPHFRPSWRQESWPLDHAVSALHAYTALAEFNSDLIAKRGPLKLRDDSLLPVSGRRLNEMGKWLVEQISRLGPDAQILVRGLADSLTKSATAESRDATQHANTGANLGPAVQSSPASGLESYPAGNNADPKLDDQVPVNPPDTDHHHCNQGFALTPYSASDSRSDRYFAIETKISASIGGGSAGTVNKPAVKGTMPNPIGRQLGQI